MRGARARRGCSSARRRRSVVKVQSAGQTLSRLFANRRCQRLRAFFGLASSSSCAEFGLDRRDLGLEPGAVVVLVLVGAPGGEHLPVSCRPCSPKVFCSPSPSAWRRKSRCRCDQHTWRCAGGRGGCSRSSGQRSRSRDTSVPISALNCSRLQCSAIWKNAASGVVAVHSARPSPRGAPAGLIDMHRVLIQHPVLQLQMRAGQRLGGALADRVRPRRSRA